MGSIWGLQFAMLKLAAEGGYSEITVLTVTLGLMALCFVILLILRRAYFRPNARALLFLFITALMGYVAPMAALLYSAPHLPAGVITLVAAFAPLVTVAIALILKTERVSRRRLFAVSLSAIGAILVIAPEITLPDAGKLEMLLVAFLVPLIFGYESIYVDTHWPRELGTFQVVTGEVVLAAFMVLPLYFIAGEPVAFDPTWPEAQTGIVIFCLVGVVEVVLYFYLVKQTGGVLVSFGSFISLFAGVFWGMLIFDERHGPLIWGAVFLVGLSLILLSRDRDRPQHAAPAPGKPS